MQYRFFTIPAEEGDSEAEEFNRFLRSHRIVTVDRTFHGDGSPRWCFAVEYLDGAKGSHEGSRANRRVDYKEVLPEDDFTVFSRLREVRKELAHAEAVPVYTVCTNEQLAAMVQNRCTSIESLKTIDGFGEARVGKYGEKLLVPLRKAFTS